MKSKHNIEKLISKNLNHLTLSFEFCTTHDLPNDKNSFKRIVETLKCFYSEQELDARRPHPLKYGSSHNDLNNIIQSYKDKTIMSIDVGKANGQSGNMRMLYYKDKDFPTEIKVVSLWFDTHQ